ncbi:bifunctional riboflavin kinase/FAD synthetase [Neptunicella marina]|uniref:Riboflavin biosynthesis protein n=1 Tax=Neptunicella marina TaxID=2125989 RepID=A0A8J6IRF8_9ALTE|nr:bifunctional riboflavin kinase/FAD synthetase [Neptunicella marina]
MELIRGLHNIRQKHRGCVLTIGKFDGVHLGHQAVLKNLVEQARKMQLPATVMVFEPQPEEVFRPQTAPARLSRLRDKYTELKKLGVDRLICVKFNREFAAQSANHFVEELLVAKLGIRFLVVGDDFRFGHDRTGDFDMLQREGQRWGFDVVSTQSFRHQDCRISSTAVRDALAAGNMQLAESLLGRKFSIASKVIHGEKKGRTIGFPTANLLLKRVKSPVAGVYAVRVKSPRGDFNGVANVGTRPTLNGSRMQLEAHLFDFDQHLYGLHIEVELLSKIRDEQKFASLDDLRQQIALDSEQAKRYFDSLHQAI